MRTTNESGVALISALLITLLMAAVLVGFAAVVASDNRLRALDDSRSEAFYAAHAGLEKLTADLGGLFFPNYAPTGAQINALMAAPPALADVQWLAADGSSGYRISYPTDANGNPAATARTVLSGPYQGFVGLVTPYTLSVTARLSDGSEASVTRTLQTVSIPVFQFGMFSETSLSFFAGPDFNFGGRVHTNGDLFLAEGNNKTLTLSDRVTAVGEVIRTNLSNGWDTVNGSPSYKGNVLIPKSTGNYRDLKANEGSLVGTLGSAQNEPQWTNLSTGTYNYNITNGRTGARRLDLPIVNFGAKPVDLVRRPPVNENNTNPDVYGQRYFGQVSLRILLSDIPGDITSLPTVTATPPVLLGDLAVNPIAGYTVGADHPPLAVSSGIVADGYRAPAGTPSLGGYLKIEKQDNNGAWTDVTLEILNLGIAGRNLNGNCAELNPNAVIRLERVRDNPSTGGACGDSPDSVVATDYWPNVLYDSREGSFRDGIPATSDTLPLLGGVMHYIEIDITNLSRWFQGVIGTTGSSANNVTGYSIYISDRRGNHNAAGTETGEYGFEDVVNPNDAEGDPDGALNTGEDVNSSNQLDIYGQAPAAVSLPPGIGAPLNNSARPWTQVTKEEARTNPAVLFRRAVKLTRATPASNIVSPGLTVVTENPVYIEGNWNADDAGFSDPHRATAVIADAVTLLSRAWNDRTSFLKPHKASDRDAQTTWYRVAIIAGKPRSFPMPTVGTVPQDFGTDGGAHNFLRYIEDWSGQTLNYRGAIATLYYSLQAVGTYKCCTTVYSPPTRAYVFDNDFLTPSLLPPRTPMFRDVNSTGFTYVIRPR